MSASPAQVLKKLLLDESLVNAHTSATWPCFINSMPDTPDNAVCTIDTGAEKQGRIMRTGEVIQKPAVQIQFRAKTFSEGWTKAKAVEAVLDALYRRSITLESIDYMLHSVRRHNTVLPLGAEPGGNRREMFSLNILLSLS